MSTTSQIKEKIETLFKTNPNVHVTVNMTSPKVHVDNQPAVIKGVYKHIFQLEENSSGKSQTHTLQYNDVLTKHVIIAELNAK
ncbi:MAG: hypothetical protein IJV77_04545 [Clostridia bacterium]|nr:hypothetical protein [Clostridia bacterium]